MNLNINFNKKKYNKIQNINWLIFGSIAIISYFLFKDDNIFIIAISGLVYVSFTFYFLKKIKYYPVSINIVDEIIEIKYIKQNMKKYSGILSNIQFIDDKDCLIFKENNNIIAIIKDSNISIDNKNKLKQIFQV